MYHQNMMLYGDHQNIKQREEILNMTENLLIALIGAGGVVLGCILSFCSQLIINKVQNKNNIIQSTTNTKIKTFGQAIKYILNLCTISTLEKTNQKEAVKLTKQNEDLYKEFYYTFQIFVSKETEEKFNDLRNKAFCGNIKVDDAYKQVCELLNFKIK